jgi:hypothetical protein
MRRDSKSLRNADGTALSMAFEQFKESSYGCTAFGKLFLALTEETAWSGDCLVRMQYPTTLLIAHKAFVPADSWLVIANEDWTDWTVRRVEDAIRAHFNDSMEAVRQKIQPLQNQVYAMDDALRRIDKAKAQAALTTAFPEAAEFAQFSPAPTNVYCFGKMMDRTPTYLVRMVNHEPIGGVACLSDMSALGWHVLSDGVEKDQRLGRFWIALAKTFAARELDVAEDELLAKQVIAVEQPWDPKMADHYLVDSVILRTIDRGEIVVKFGPDNLPAEAEFVPAQAAESA